MPFWTQKKTFRESFTVKIRVATTESETSSSREEKALIVLLRVHCEPLFSSYGCWHLKPQFSSSSSWCTASSASRYHYLTPPQDSSNHHSSLWADPEHDLPLQVQKQYKIRFKQIKKTKAESEEYTISSRAISESSKHSEVRSCTVPQSTSVTDQLSSTCLLHWTIGYKGGDTLLWLTVVYI